MRRHLTKYHLLYLTALAAIAAALIAWRFPVFFRGDDAAYLAWAQEHANPLVAFSPSAAVLFGSYRPVQNLAWWALFRAFGLRALPYQFTATLLFLLSFVFYYRAAARLCARSVGFGALIAWAATFSFLAYVVFWFSDLTFILEIFFLNLALCLLAPGLAEGGRRLVFGLIAFAVAALAKEPAALILPLVLLIFLWTSGKTMDRPRFRRAMLITVGLLAVGALWVFANPYMRGRQLFNSSLGISTFVYYAGLRWSFYARHLVSGAGALSVFAVLYLAFSVLVGKANLTRDKSVALSLTLSAALTIVLRTYPSLALVAVFLAFVPLAATRHVALAGAAWFAAPLLGLLNVGFFARTYLIEASFGLALVVGAALAELAGMADELRRRLPDKARFAALAALVALVAAGAVVAASKINACLATLQTVSDTRQNFREMTEYILAQLDQPGANLVVIEYADLGLDYTTNILDLPDREKAARQKTMTGEEYARFLRAAGARNLAVRDLTWFKHRPADEPVYVLAMNAAEKRFVGQLPAKLLVLREVSRGNTGAWLFVPAGLE